MANHLSLEKRTQIVHLLCEGNSLRATARLADVAFNTVLKMIPEIGKACMAFHDEKVMGVKADYVQADEIWSFCYSKQKNVPEGMEGQAGDIWTWTAIDADSKLIISWLVGERNAECAELFMKDLRRRTTGRIQLTTDSLNKYKSAVFEAFGRPNLDYAQLHKQYASTQSEGRYSPAECTGIKKKAIAGEPDENYISTSYVERQNLTMRMHMRRFTRLTNAFSKKAENHMYAVALYFVYYNFVKIHKTLRVTPAMEAGLTDKLMEFSDIVKLTETYSK